MYQVTVGIYRNSAYKFTEAIIDHDSKIKAEGQKITQTTFYMQYAQMYTNCRR